jgi:hypothetical protein
MAGENLAAWHFANVSEDLEFISISNRKLRMCRNIPVNPWGWSCLAIVMGTVVLYELRASVTRVLARLPSGRELFAQPAAPTRSTTYNFLTEATGVNVVYLPEGILLARTKKRIARQLSTPEPLNQQSNDNGSKSTKQRSDYPRRLRRQCRTSCSWTLHWRSSRCRCFVLRHIVIGW